MSHAHHGHESDRAIGESDHHGHTGATHAAENSFSRDSSGLPEAISSETVVLRDGASFELRSMPVRKRIGNATMRMLAYNGSIPGPTLKVEQGSEWRIDFTNQIDLETTVHWHGLRLDNRFDGVPTGAHHGMQPPIPQGGSFSYRLRFPDPGVYWYHPHIREDYTQELGLYGSIVVIPSDPEYWSPVNRDLTLMLDDILIDGGDVAAYSRAEPNRTAMGRFGNVMLTNGATDYSIEASQGEVIRLYLTNTANVRTFNFRISGARMKLVGRDQGRVEHEEAIEEILIAPAERVVLDVLFERAGELVIEHRTPDQTYRLGTVRVSEQALERSYEREFYALRRSEELAAERERIAADFDRVPDKTLALVGEMPGMGHHEGHSQVALEHGDSQGDAHSKHGADHGQQAGADVPNIEWEDTMPAMNEMSTPRNMHWKLVDRETGAVNHDIWWAFTVGDRVKLRIVNDPHSDHPMQHPFHIHGQRFLVLARDGVRNDNLAWKDTVLLGAGETVDLLVDMSNPGIWMSHCHIAEHLEGGMMFSFAVEEVGHETS